MLSRRLQYGAGSIILVLIVLGILIVVNFMSTRHFSRADLTEEKIYSLSDSTKKILKELDDIVTINVYFSKKAPPNLLDDIRKMRDLLYEYKALSGGNLAVEFIDSTKDDEIKEKAQSLGIKPVQESTLERDKIEVVIVYLGIEVTYRNKKEVIPEARLRSLEYDLTAAIAKVKRTEAKTVGFLKGHGEYDTAKDSGYKDLRLYLEKIYSVVDVNVSGGTKVPDNVNTLIIGGPKKKFSERDKYEIDQFIMRGGRVVFLIDPVDIDFDQPLWPARKIDTNLDDMLGHYGAELGDNLVLDGGSAERFIELSFFPYIRGDGFAKDSRIVDRLDSLILPWASPVNLIQSKMAPASSQAEAENTTTLSGIELCRTGTLSWVVDRFRVSSQLITHLIISFGPRNVQDGLNYLLNQLQYHPEIPYYLDPRLPYEPSGDPKSYPLAVAVSGKFRSFYADKAVPKPDTTDEDTPEIGLPEETGQEKTEGRETIKESPETQIVVVGNASFVSGHLNRLFEDNLLEVNLPFIGNIVDWLAIGDDLIGIRSRGGTDRPIRLVSEGEVKAEFDKDKSERKEKATGKIEKKEERRRRFIRLVNILGIPSLIVVFALARFLLKRWESRKPLEF